MSLQLPEADLNNYWDDVSASLATGGALSQTLEGGGLWLEAGVHVPAVVGGAEGGPTRVWNHHAEADQGAAVCFDALAAQSTDVRAIDFSSLGLEAASADAESPEPVDRAPVLSSRSGQGGPGLS